MNNFNISSAQIELLVALTETGSFSDAAKRLGLTQSAVSHSLARMETELGAVLVERGRRGIHLTPTGAAILPYAQEVLDRLEAIRQVSAAAAGEAQGKIRLGIAPPFPAFLLSEIIQRFRSEYPAVELTIFEDIAVGEKPSLAEGRMDIVFTAQILSNTERVPFREEPIYTVLPSSHPLAQVESITTATLVNEPLIIPRYGRDMVTERLRRPEGSAERSPVRHFVSTTSIALAMAEAGMGIALLAESSLEGIATDLVQRPLDPQLLLPLFLTIRNRENLSPIATAFMDCAIMTSGTL